MSLTLVQLRTVGGARRVAAAEGEGPALLVDGVATVYQLACDAMESGSSLLAAVRSRRSAEPVDLWRAEDEGRLLPPIDHPDDAHLHLTGTGLTHLGSAESRDRMHRETAGENLTDSMRMFRMGLEGGKPPAGGVGVQPEWFYKGDGSCVVGSGVALPVPGFALDGSEEPEIAGVYLIDRAGTPRRLGFCLANEFSDHVTERGNYLWLAHSKLLSAALGPELRTEIPADIRGTSRILRDGATLWERPFLTGEANMSHSIGNLEHHHFKYAMFRRPGDVHVHFFGTATLSFADGICTQPGDVFEIEAPPFRLGLRNPRMSTAVPEVAVQPL
jgi:hypothetical protein